MLQPILTPEKLWPGGIPSSVRPHPDGELTDGPEESDWKEWEEECKGWCQFVEEKWVPMTDLDKEMQQRRALIATWASAHQEFRDSYQGRAPSRNSALDYPQHLLSKVELGEKRFFCLASVDKEQDADNYSRLVKSLILLYLHDDQGTGHPLKHAAGESPQIPDLLATSSTSSDYTKFFSYHDLLFNLYLHPADFRAVSMTRSGTVIFPEQYSNIPYTVISQDNLNQGRVAVMTFKPNGTIGQYANLFSWNFARVMSYYHGLAWPFSEIFNYEHSECPFAAPYLNEPINMNEPLLDIVKFLMQRGDLHVFRGSMADWGQQIRKFAPGYLELEAQGQEVEFDLANLWNEKRLRYSHHTNDLRRKPIPQ